MVVELMERDVRSYLHTDGRKAVSEAAAPRTEVGAVARTQQARRRVPTISHDEHVAAREAGKADVVGLEV